jgi:hypothetical protein
MKWKSDCVDQARAASIVHIGCLLGCNINAHSRVPKHVDELVLAPRLVVASVAVSILAPNFKHSALNVKCRSDCRAAL